MLSRIKSIHPWYNDARQQDSHPAVHGTLKVLVHREGFTNSLKWKFRFSKVNVFLRSSPEQYYMHFNEITYSFFFRKLWYLNHKTLLFRQSLLLKIAARLRKSIVCMPHLFYFSLWMLFCIHHNSTDLDEKPDWYDSGSICKQNAQFSTS